ncbi:MAG TPA: hypothetical protein P5526_06800 [Anaerolineae bacterium]|nr:hypothetical protein [Anaerolineae bacterium]MCB0176687.1 hypothetical protein [Anaerolineae bacterium]MCB9104671.1 hypothetical protein [Anaerolineales bacterium]HRV91853.1 hypothetical protein [Anaerolineae bacterium]
MTAEITTVIGQLSIREGVWRQNAPNQVAVREPKAADAPGAGKGDLFIVTEIQGNVDNRDAMEQKLAQAIRDSYYLARGSITASLRRAIQAGNDLLYHRNLKVEVEDRVVGGAVIVVSCQEDAFVGQIGPTAFFAVLGDHVRRYPARSVWLDEAMGPGQEEDASALGLRKIVEPTLQHVRVEPEDMLVLADSRLAGQLPLSDLVHAVDSGDVKTAIKELGEVAKAKNCSALILEVVEMAAAAGPFKLATPSKLSDIFNRRSHAVPVDPSPESPWPEPVEADGEPVQANGERAAVFAHTSILQKSMHWLDRFKGQPEPDEPPEPPAAEFEPPPLEEFEEDTVMIPTKRPMARPYEGEKWSTPHHKSNRPEAGHGPGAYIPNPVAPQSTLLEREYAGDANDDETASDRSPLQTIVYGLGSGLLMLVLLISNAFKGLFRLVLPASSQQKPRQAGMQAQAENSSSSVPWKLLRNIAIAIPILVAIIVGISYIQKGRLRDAEYNDFLTAAQSKIEQAREVDSSAALGLMAEAENSLTQAEQIKPDEEHPEITAMRQQIAAETDRVGHVQRLDAVQQLRQYTDAGTQTSSIVVEGVEIYIMDKGNDRIYHHSLDNEGVSLLPDGETVLIAAKGQQVDNIQVGELLDMTWMPTGGNRQTSDLVVLNSTGLLEYSTNWGLASSMLAATDALKLPVAVDSYFGNFYVLDPQANVLLRYLPTVDGYNAPPQNYFAANVPVDLSNAVDLAIDGAVYVLYQDGRIAKFQGGQPAEFNVTGLDVPFNNPVAIFTKPDEDVQHIYVADAGNHRIVQLNKDGSFVRQFKPSAGEAASFANLQNIYVDEIGGKMFVLDSNNLYLVKLPTE